MTVSVGYDELARGEPLAAGDLVPCVRCGGEHRVAQSEPADPGPRVPLSDLVSHPSGHWHKRAVEDDWTRVCGSCRESGSVPGDFPHCGPHQWQQGGRICDACGTKVHAIGTFQSDRGPGYWHVVDSGTRLCGPVSSDPDWPDAWQCYGEHARRSTTLLSFTCGGDTFVVGMNGRSLPAYAAERRGPMTMTIARTTTYFHLDLRDPRWHVNPRFPKSDSVDQNRWAVQPGARTRHGHHFGPAVATFRTKAEAVADARRRREEDGQPTLEMVESTEITRATRATKRRGDAERSGR